MAICRLRLIVLDAGRMARNAAVRRDAPSREPCIDADIARRIAPQGLSILRLCGDRCATVNLAPHPRLATADRDGGWISHRLIRHGDLSVAAGFLLDAGWW